jgi:DNA-binding MarR family transcriptional regulator
VDRRAESAHVFGLLARFVHRTGQEASAELKRHGLTPAQFQLLLAVQRDPASTQRELGERFDVTGANISMLIAKLEAAGLLRREPDGAANRVLLTDAGRELVARLEPEQDRFLVERFAALSDAQLHALRELVDTALRGLARTD